MMQTHRAQRMKTSQLAVLVLLAVAALAMIAAPAARAHGAETHDHADAAVAGGGGGAEVPAAPANGEPAQPPEAINDPAPGAQPAAPGEDAVAAAVEVEPGVIGDAVATEMISEPIVARPKVASRPKAAAAPKVTVDGGGTDGHAGHAPASSPVAVPAGAPVVTGGGGDLPFTGVEENILLISLAGMLAPMGVLLWCAARRGDVKLALAMPRFAWAAPREPLVDPIEHARIAREQAARSGAAFDWAAH